MTTEDDFRRALDANPKDWQTLAVLSDWLRERDDPRADGYAALVRHQKRPKPEIDFLMALLREYLLAERQKILDYILGQLNQSQSTTFQACRSGLAL